MGHCRMSVLGLVVLLAWCWCTMPDKTVDVRQQKIDELWRSLGEYKIGKNVDSTKNFTMKNHIETSAGDNSVKTEDTSSTETFKDQLKPKLEDLSSTSDESMIDSYEDYYRTFYGAPTNTHYLKNRIGPKSLQEARAKFRGANKSLNDVSLANKHYLHMQGKGKCRTPLPQVVRVKDYFPDPSKEYIPRCTILHRCGDYTGCCDSDAYHCVPNAVQEVALHFYVLTVKTFGLPQVASDSIEKLLFQNHTSCQCQPINNLPRIEEDTEKQLQPPKISKCGECPVPFTSRIYKDGRCGCDCFDRQKSCVKIKRGKEPLSDIERRCVESHHCHIPDCEFGLFNTEAGFCPKRHDEEIKSHHRRPNQPSQSQRWSFLERD